VGAVNQPVAIAVGRTARAVLLLATALGLALMHTLGHTGVRVEMHPVVAAMSAQASDAGVMPVMLTAAADPCPDGHCDGHGGHGFGVWSVCLAILAALAVAVLLLVLWAFTRRHRSVPPAADFRVRSPRGPPDRPAGLTLASAAVLRI
jgi:disulfide bond formation protein DsbB